MNRCQCHDTYCDAHSAEGRRGRCEKVADTERSGQPLCFPCAKEWDELAKAELVWVEPVPMKRS